jgi:outer membrane protein OmpA-like peptidoglycan-associated protein
MAGNFESQLKQLSVRINANASATANAHANADVVDYEPRFRQVQEIIIALRDDFEGKLKAVETEVWHELKTHSHRPITPEKPKVCCDCKQHQPPDQETSLFRVMNGNIFLKKPVEFDKNSAVLDDGDFELIKRLAELFKAYPRYEMTLAGYTAGSGAGDADTKVRNNLYSADGNKASGTFQDLSRWRAEAVVNALKGMGIAGSRMTAEGRGTDGKGKRTEITARSSANCNCSCHR